jgi:hypothetical protein
VSAIDHATTGIFLSKNGGALAIRSQSVTASTYDAYGNYRVTLSTTDTNTIGTLRMQFSEAATCLPVWQDFMVVGASSYTLLTAGTVSTVADNWAALISGLTTTGSIGKFVVDNLDTKVSTVPGLTWDQAKTSHTTADTFGDYVDVKNSSRLAPTAAGRTLDVTTTGEVGVDLSNVNGTLDAAEIGADAITAAKVAPDVGVEFANSLLDLSNGVETNYTLRQWARILAAVIAGRSSGNDTNAPIFRDWNNTKNRVTSSTNATGRTAVTLDPN